jgi:ferritin-like protein
MGENSAQLHEDPSSLRPETIERHRAVASLMEELEAVDWYDQRVDATDDGALREILAHNRDEEKEHAAMALEWLRRHDPVLDLHLRRYLFTEESIVAEEEEAEAAPAAPAALTIGPLRDKEVV